MKHEEIITILHELYDIDPSFREHEEELKQLIQTLVEHAPKPQPRAAFVKRLRKELLKQTNTTSMKTTPQSFRWVYALGGALVLVLILTPLALLTLSQPSSVLKMSFAPSITDVGENAFGSLAVLEGFSEPAVSEDGLGAASSVMRIGSGGGIGLTEDAQRIAPEPFFIWRYSYDGELPIDQVDGKVYRRVKNPINTRQLASTLGGFNLGLFDASRYSNVTNYAMIEPGSNGYMVNVDFNEGLITISPNWQEWNFENQTPVTKENFPDDATIIGIAQQFVRERGIDTSLYGQPEIDMNWKTYIQEVEARGEVASYPYEVSVKYPLAFEGIPVYEQWGGEFGMTVQVSVSMRKAVGAYNIIYPEFESSTYDMERGVERIQEAIANGGNQYRYFDSVENGNVITYALEAPQVVYMHYGKYDGKQTQQLFVPALRFEVAEQQDEALRGSREIVVPLIKDWYDEAEILEPPIVLPVEPLELPATLEIQEEDQVLDEVSIRAEYEGKIVYEYGQDEKALEGHCSEKGGVVNTCGSSCAPDAQICTRECALTCEY
jgi:hypothetical protein